jgi:hypothetical protein
VDEKGWQIQVSLRNGYRYCLRYVMGWVDANHPSFQNCIIDTSANVCVRLNHVTENIIEEAITTTDPDIIGILLVLDAEAEEISEGMCNIDHEAVSPYTIHTAVPPKPSLIDANVNSAITAMLDIVQPKNDDVDEYATYDNVLPHEKYAQNRPIIPVSCESNEPIVEFNVSLKKLSHVLTE